MEGVSDMANLFTQIGNRIQHILETKQMSQSELAERIGVSRQVMSKIVNGKKAINVEEISKIAVSIGVSLDDLMKLESLTTDTDPILVMMGTISKGNTKDDLRFLNHIMDEMILLEELLGVNGVI